ncbi:MAG: hypothetical protein HS101_18420 [Planctomycetia bacterium]|nr:hypothetical protein [Planctomycetia bacterium]
MFLKNGQRMVFDLRLDLCIDWQVRPFQLNKVMLSIIWSRLWDVARQH